MLDDEALARLVRKWFDRSKGGRTNLNEPHDKFICLWIAFNAWGARKTNEDKDGKMIKLLKKDSELRASYERCKKDPEFRDKVAEREGDRIYDDRYGTFVSLDDGMSFRSVLGVIYQIRCNLFHGRKVPDNVRDLELVAWAHAVLSEVFGNVVGPIS